MGMRSQMSSRTGGSYQSGGTSSYPVTGFPQSAYLGNNRRVGGGNQSQPSPMAGGIGQSTQYNPQHALLTIAVLIVVGVLLWHLDNR
jgi:hypothetical protein